MEFTKNNKLWIYILSKKTYDDYSKTNFKYISHIDNPGISKSDIILIYLKNRKSSGFSAILKLNSDFKLNNQKIKIFRDDNLNLYYSDIGDKIIFPKPVRAAILFDKNQLKFFQTRYLKDINIINKFDNQADILNKLLDIHKNPNTKIQSDKKPIKKPKNPNPRISDNTSSDSQSDNNSENPDIFIKNSENISDQESEDEFGYIPILILPCNSLELPKIPDINKKKYFITHYQTCQSCDIINNNNGELSSIIQEADFEFMEITQKNNAYLDIPLESYLALKKYEPLDSKSKKYIRVLYINNSHELYNGCYLITWSNKK